MAPVSHRPRARRLRFLPIVERELRLAARGTAMYRWRTWVTAAALGMMALFTMYLVSARTPAAVQGRVLFYALIGVSAAYAVGASLAATADTISREKRDGTLGLLFLTDLRGVDIVLGKLAANSLNTVYGLLGLLPLLAIPVMLGGVSIEAGVLAALGVVNLLFFSLSLGIFVSTISWDERRATFAAMIAFIVLAVWPLLMGGIWVWFFGRGTFLRVMLGGLSPVFPLLGAVPSPVQAQHSLLPFLGLAPSHLLAWFLLAWAARLVSGAWHSRSGNPVRRTVDERLFAARDPERRQRQRGETLDVHPLVWLLERHPGKRFYADILVFAIFLIWVWGYRRYGVDMFGGPTWYLVVPLAFAMHLILTSWIVAECSMRLVADRRSGALELLMSTSQTDLDLIRGLRLALRRLFLRPVVIFALAEVYVAFTGFGTVYDRAAEEGRWMMLAMAGALVMDTYGLSWIALRLAVSMPTVNRVGTYALAITPFGPIAVTAAAGLLAFLVPGFREHVSFVRLLGVWLAAVAVVNLAVGAWGSRRWLLRNFRVAVSEGQPRAAVAA